MDEWFAEGINHELIKCVPHEGEHAQLYPAILHVTFVFSMSSTVYNRSSLLCGLSTFHASLLCVVHMVGENGEETRRR